MYIYIFIGLKYCHNEFNDVNVKKQKFVITMGINDRI